VGSRLAAFGNGRDSAAECDEMLDQLVRASGALVLHAIDVSGPNRGLQLPASVS
jgi:hypothetical protein